MTVVIALQVIFDEYVASKAANGFYEADSFFLPTAGALTFVRKLRHRIQTPMDFFNEWEKP